MVRCGHGLEEMELLLLGRTEMPFGLGDRLFGWPVVPLFRLEALRVQRDPIAEQENARFLLYRCRGGYPIGFIALYARSPIAAMGEREETQLFFTVGFNFYGRKGWSRNRPLRRLWQFIHDRVTGNVLNRIKFLCEARPQGVSP